MKFRKKPVVIEAEQFFPGHKPHPEGVEEFIARQTEDSTGFKNTWYGWRVQTLEGPLAVSPGDWIITGIKGEKYPCKPDIFDATYEIVDERGQLLTAIIAFLRVLSAVNIDGGNTRYWEPVGDFENAVEK